MAAEGILEVVRIQLANLRTGREILSLAREVDGLLRSLRQRRPDLAAAGTVATVAGQEVTIITLFAGIEDAVATAAALTVKATKRVGQVAVILAVIALFARIERTVATTQQDIAAIVAASIHGALRQHARFALLTERMLHHTVAATALLPETRSATTVEVTLVAVVAFLTWINHAVATGETDSH